MYAVIEVNGGIGKNIMATAVISGIKKKFPERKVVVVTGWPEVFLNNPEVYRVFKFGGCPYFYADYVFGKDTMFFCDEPYRSNGYLRQEESLIKSWCRALDVPDDAATKIFLNPREIEMVKDKLRSKKPLMIFQPFGGAPNMDKKYGWNRDIPPQQAVMLAQVFSKQFDIIQPVLKDTPKLPNCNHVNVPLRELFGLIYISDSIIGIDSCVQHAAAALDKKATVCWVTNTPTVFGYDIHTNIFPMPESYLTDKRDAVGGGFQEYDFTGGNLVDYPFKDSNIFNVAQIEKSVIDAYNARIVKPISHESVIKQIESVSTPSEDNIPHIDRYFDHIYYINMDRRSDRKTFVEKQLLEANIMSATRMEGFDVNKIGIDHIDKSLYANFHLDRVQDKSLLDKYLLGAIGCKISHVNCIKDAKRNGYRKILILEDDVLIDKQANIKFQKFSNQVGDQWKLMYLGGDYWENGDIWQLSSYAVDSSLFDEIIEGMPSTGLENDWYMVHVIQPKYRKEIVKLSPPIFTQTKTDSDLPTMLKPRWGG